MSDHDTWPERIKWAEDVGLKNLQEKFSTADNINREAQTTLTYVLSGMGATFGYSLIGLEKSATLAVFVAMVLCLYFTLLGLYLIFRTQFLGAYPSTYQEPKNLINDPHVPIDKVRLGEINNIKERIKAAESWIAKKADAVNIVRAGLVLSLFVALIAVPVYKCAGSGWLQSLVDWITSS